MNYLFTCAGEGSRFIKKGVKPPKPIIKVFGDELLIWSIRSFAINPSDNVFIVSQLKHKCKKILEDEYKEHMESLKLYGDPEIIQKKREEEEIKFKTIYLDWCIEDLEN